jgi:uncharacterized protein YgbK (DUF1537 family)
MTRLLGCIADDFTGATDLANMLVRGGMRTVQCLGVPEQAEIPLDADAVVVALKSRSIPARDAIELSLRALRALQAAGIRRFLFKYCSTFDSTDRGNIGPVAESLMEALGVEQTVFCPALPENGRTIYMGHLFVNGRLLNESGMQHHPLNPMTDADLARVLQRQSSRRTGLLTFDDVTRGPQAITERIAAFKEAGIALVVADAVNEQHLRDLGRAVANMPLITGGSGIAIGLPDAYRQAGLLQRQSSAAELPRVAGRAVVLSGSCSAATQRQVRAFLQRSPGYAIDVRAAVTGQPVARSAIEWAAEQHRTKKLADDPVMIYSTAAPDDVAALQHEFGREKVAKAVEQTLADVARGLVELGVRRFVVAGGETAGAIVEALGVRALRIGLQIDPGVPWTESLGQPPLALALKSGNFGSDDFFHKALEMLP